ncbi:SAM-dependent methyltransferase [Pseudoclavibacter sp. RFBJ3]|uniref:bifunctional PIG-L family deacetylase/class I SAM-dependent methyltransferase n=1 Tax=unclassified Pseudoclavibacter TaxID=2615177 RepID=UPI000CE7A083|nr:MULTISPECIES: bifunctional PIG-L family deacetylase/class I SAM-dependent methyltransferase [unclassified Pseudoclavibacter]PPF84941.1 SAM-dependent methyltransferase [Pseudoclavibacter sp. RFBJ5]PPF93945.1 SAM-dependent methyltransferase [Pseudoclavibacter sp. RFBJ3]PPF98662.1 SAM-dependent methyltransferase [Pseudoclavibacter sp. RFBH5]PPG24377.1 SAM-dependent methyltransferase [Pseudoclavibacter sp. RFBI4]
MIGAASVEFTHLDTGTPEAAWREAGIEHLPTLALEDALGPETLLIVGAAHPDDECLGAAGLIRRALAAGAAVRVLLCTWGEASHPASPSVQPPALAELRRAEFHEALRRLRTSPSAGSGATGGQSGSIESVELGLGDGQLSQSTDLIAEAAAKMVRNSPAQRVVIAAPYRRDGHTDHDTVGAALARAAAESGALLLEFPIWFWHWAHPARDSEWRHWMRLPLSPGETDDKAAALDAHASQLHALSDEIGDETVLGASQVEHFSRSFEVFRVTASATRDAGSASHTFDGVHADADDPWDLRSSWYERRKLALMVGMLPDETYGRALEIGCSIGESTAALAERCDHLLAVDASATALGLAAARLADLTGVDLAKATLPHDWDSLGLGPGQLDLVIVSETGYYLAEDELCELLANSRRALSPTGVLVLCHWRGPIDGWPLDGDRVHALAARLGMRSLASYVQDETLIDIYENGMPPSGGSCFASAAASDAQQSASAAG